MSKQRLDAWSSEEDQTLAEIVLKHIREGSTQLKAFEEAGDVIERTANACQFRWNDTLRKQYSQEFEMANKIRRKRIKNKNALTNEIARKEPLPKVNKKEVIYKNVTDLEVKEFNGQRVILLKDIDEVHGRPEGTARKRFNDNKKHFIEGEDYFVRNPHEAAREYGIIAPNGLKLITESGYLMLVKSFTDDLAWDVQKNLVKTYFRTKQNKEISLPQSYEEALEHLLVSVKKEKEAQKQIEVLSPKAERYEDLMNAENCQDMNQVAKAFKTGRNRLFSYLREQKVILADKPLPYQKYIEKGYFIVIEVEKNNLAHPKTLVTPLGIDFIAKLLQEQPPKDGFFDKVKALFAKKNPLLPTTDN